MDIVLIHQGDKILSITTDNASNNETMTKALESTVAELIEDDGHHIYRVLCLAHVIQLLVKALTNNIKATATNDEITKSISQEEVNALKTAEKGFGKTLNLVSEWQNLKKLANA